MRPIAIHAAFGPFELAFSIGPREEDAEIEAVTSSVAAEHPIHVGFGLPDDCGELVEPWPI